MALFVGLALHDAWALLCQVKHAGDDWQRAGKSVVAIATKNYWSDTWRDVQSLGFPALTFILTQLIGGLPLLPYALLHLHSDDLFRYPFFLTLPFSSSLLQLPLPS